MDLEEQEEIKKYNKGFGYKFEIDSRRLEQWENDLDWIVKAIREKDMFRAGYCMSELMNEFSYAIKELEKWEKIEEDKKAQLKETVF